ncbi:hypothetical protein EJB05_22592, partial [Eragrostis curvula]
MELTLPLLLLHVLVLLASRSLANADGGNTTTYIVFMDAARMPAVHASPAHWHAAHLQSLSIDPERHLLYSYSAAAHGFAAALLPAHLPLLRGSPEVLQVVPDAVLHLHTTRTPEFLGLLSPAYQPAIRSLDVASHDVVVGVLDTGVWPESPSFAGGDLPPPPARWKGVCEAGVDFPASACGRKLVGARSFSRGLHAARGGGGVRGPVVIGKREFRSARDRDGHGTHTASTAAGAVVANASLLGYATGTARGMAPGARVAAYKVCWPQGCLASDILAGIDAAVADGVGVLSLSLGGGAAPYFRDTVAIGAFGASAAGVFVSCSAGNSGPSGATVSNSAPWVATVGAGTLDRDFPAYVTLPTGARLAGVSLYAGPSRPRLRPRAPPCSRSKLCLSGTLDPANVRGKIVLCDRGVNARVEKGAVVKAAGGAGMVLANTAASGEELVADSHLLPAVAVGRSVGDKIREYVTRGGRQPMAMLSFGGTVLGVRPSPVVAAFSSRGPNTVVPEVLKPDMIGPGVNILAAWTGVAGPTGLAKDGRRTHFNIISGTSMSCPHISGVAALLKAAHPDWSPAAIKSALMTTAYTVDNTNSSLRDAAGGSPANPFSYGAGHVDPQKALSPGLVYDASTKDYVDFLCSLKYNPLHIQVITKMSNVSCPKKFRPGDLNYPSFSVVFKQKSKRVMRFRRELTNVGPAMSVYNVKVSSPASVSVTVSPAKLRFKKMGEKQRYYVTFSSKAVQGSEKPDFGWISWVNDEHVVRSPVAYTWKM